MEKPWTRVIGLEPNRNVISGVANAHNITDDRILEVVRRVAGTTNHVEGMPVQVDGVLRWHHQKQTR